MYNVLHITFLYTRFGNAHEYSLELCDIKFSLTCNAVFHCSCVFYFARFQEILLVECHFHTCLISDKEQI